MRIPGAYLRVALPVRIRRLDPGLQALNLPAGGVGGDDLVAVAAQLLEQADLLTGSDRLTARDERPRST